MGIYIEVLFLALALSADAFSVALGVGCRFSGIGTACRLSLSFGFAQFLMPLTGALLGSALGKYFDGMKYVAAVILFLIAFKMVREARKGSDTCLDEDPARGWKLLALTLATSMDAFGVGFSLAAMQIHIMLSSAIIGVVCALCTAAGIYVGRACMGFIGKYATYLGAAVLIVIGIKTMVV